MDTGDSGIIRNKNFNATVGDFHKIIDFLLFNTLQAPFSIEDIISNTNVAEDDVVEFLDILDKAFSLKSELEQKKTLQFNKDVIRAEKVYNQFKPNEPLLISAADISDEEPIELISGSKLPSPKKANKAKKSKISSYSDIDTPIIDLTVNDVKNINDFDLICSVTKEIGRASCRESV